LDNRKYEKRDVSRETSLPVSPANQVGFSKGRDMGNSLADAELFENTI
jgi:hypothetical protein